MGVYVTKPHWPGGRGEKESNTGTPPKATPKDLFIQVLKSITLYWPLRKYDLGPSIIFYLSLIKAIPRQENKTLLSITHKKEERKKKGKGMEGETSLKK